MAMCRLTAIWTKRARLAGKTAMLAGVAFSMAGSAVAQSSPSPWVLEAARIDPAAYHGETVANGMIGIVTAPSPFGLGPFILNGTYENDEPDQPLYPKTIATSFNVLGLSLAIDSTTIARLDQVSGFTQSIDYRTATFTTRFAVPGKARVATHLRALRSRPNSAMLEIEITPTQAIEIDLNSEIIASAMQRDTRHTPLTLNNYHPIHGANPIATAVARGPTGTIEYGGAQTFLFDEPLSRSPRLAHTPYGLHFARRLEAGKTYRFALLGSTISSAQVDDPVNAAARLTGDGAVEGRARLIAAHERDWRALWQGNIVIEGDPESQRDVNAMLFHLYSFIREDSGYSIAPMGLSRARNGYSGHIFWDAETWMFPVLLALQPQLARTMLDYRFERLEAARRNARLHGDKGAKFPWESTSTGDENVWSAGLGPRLLHITGVVGCAAWDYYRVTGDRQWLREKGFPLIRATADFWAGRVERNGPGRYDITGVIAADEYAEDVDNAASTNGFARANLRAAIAASRVLGLEPDPDWVDVERNIPLKQMENGVTRAYDGYRGGEIKQADANLLAYPLGLITDPAQIGRDLDYYAQKVDHKLGPAMGKSIFAILYQRLGRTEQAYAMFKDGYGPLERAPFGVLAECVTCQNPYFATGAGGNLQAVMFGFAGLDITDQGIVQLEGKLPARWKSLAIHGVGPDKRTFERR